MSMFCYQCQETARNIACTKRGVCGKLEDTSNLQDLLIYVLQGIALVNERSGSEIEREDGRFVCEALFATITNANFDNERISKLIRRALRIRDRLAGEAGEKALAGLPDAAIWSGKSKDDFEGKSKEVGVLSYSDDQDIRSLKSLLLYGIKGIAAYTDHAAVLGYFDDDIFGFLFRALGAIASGSDREKLTSLALEAGEAAVKSMALLDKANTGTYGHPEMTRVNIGVGKKPGILISGHDLRDMEELLVQTEGQGVDVYTHSEMLPANYYPAFKKYDHFFGNYGNSWWKQNKEFESFNGPILMTTNCIIPVRDSYAGRIFTTGMAGYPGVKHIPAGEDGGRKDFSEIIKMAKECDPPEEIESGEIVGGFAHNQVMALADKIVEAVKSGAIKRFIVMAGCDGRQSVRGYYTEVAEELPEGTVILTAGCAKYRYNKLDLGDIGGIPRVLDAGQCNDSYSIALIALKLKEIFGAEDVNDLPVSLDIAWYEQKAVTVLLALLQLGFKDLRLGPTLPAFLSPDVAALLVEKFGIKPIGEVKEDVEAMMKGE